MARNTTSGYWRQHGAGRKGDGQTPAPSPAVVPSALTFSFSPITDFGTGNSTGKVLPKGARVLETIVAGADVDGGTSPTFNIGFEGALTELVANQATANAAARVLVADAPLTENKEILVGLGTGTAATAGTITATVVYVMDDDGSLNN
jgi:hypothetical protein